MRISSTYLPNVATSALLHLRVRLNEVFPFSIMLQKFKLIQRFSKTQLYEKCACSIK